MSLSLAMPWTLSAYELMQEEQIQEKNKKHPVIVYSKSWCPYCGEVGLQTGHPLVPLQETNRRLQTGYG